MLDLFLTCHCPPALEAYARDQTNPLVLALTQQSHAPEIAEMLLTAGCSADCLFESSLERKSFPEPVTPLLWLLRQESASTKCRTLVTALLKAGANPNFRSPALNKTPLILAAQHQNLNVVTELLAFEAEFSTEDSSGRTPLSYAAEAGDFAIMQALIRAGAPANDESLHFAARGCQVKCVQLLLEHGADINFPSTRNGLTPLGELCLNGAGGQLIKQPLKYTLRILLTANPDLNVQAHGKSILLLALDNPKPVDMTKALLEAGIRNSINDDVHLYISNKQHCYSPTMYVKQGINRADPEHMNELLRVLQMFGCKDRFWNSGPGSQPPGACGYPPDIKRRVDEEDRMDKIRRTAEERQAQLEKERREEEELIRRRDEAEERRLERARQMHQLQRDNLNVRY
jgi:ankyrin repeat protein